MSDFCKLTQKLKILKETKYMCFLCECELNTPYGLKKGDEGNYTTNKNSIKLNRMINLQDKDSHWNDIGHAYFCSECYRSVVHKVCSSIISEKKNKKDNPTSV